MELGVDFVELVKDMRAAQRAYFRGKKPADLDESKRLEKLVDKAIREGQIPVGHGYRQTKIFNDEEANA